MNLFQLILKQTVTLAFRKGGGALGTLAFYIIIVTLFTFALGPEIMQDYAGAVMSVALLLAITTGLPLMFERDYEEGTLEQYLLKPVLLEVLVLAKICGQFIAIALPLLIVSPLLAVMVGLDTEQTAQTMLRLLLASPTLVALGAVAAALTIGSRRGGLLQALVVMPLTIPVLIFAANTGEGTLLFLLGMLLAALPLACIISAALIRISQD